MEKILILGGTQFIGRNLVEQLSHRTEYQLTIFNRQKTNLHLFPDLAKIKGDRETDDIQQIQNGDWDYVIDVSCYYPKALKHTLSCLNKDLKNYVFISSCSAYEVNSNPLKDESARILNCNATESVDRTNASYGKRKAESERLLQQSGLNHTIFRPALVYGKYDHTDRFYYWIAQVKNGRRLLLPDEGRRRFSVTYVPDLVNAIVGAVDNPQLQGDYNVISTPETSIRRIVESVSKYMGQSHSYTNAPPEFLKENEIQQWTDMPLWIDGDHFTFSNEKLKKDAHFQPVLFETSIQEVVDYYDGLGWPKPQYGMSGQRRLDLLNKLMG